MLPLPFPVARASAAGLKASALTPAEPCTVVPQLGGAVALRAGQRGPAGAERQGAHCVAGHHRRADLAPGRDVPEPVGAVLTTAGQKLAVRAERDRGHLRRAGYQG